jgi:hypothetical protein
MEELHQEETALTPVFNFHSKDLHIEKNLGLSLPFCYRTSRGGIAEVEVKSVIGEQGIISTRMSGERLGAFEHDILMIWCSMAKEQVESGLVSNKEGKLRVHYTISNLCTRLRLSTNTRSRVRKAIDVLFNYTMDVKNFAFMKETNEIDVKNETIRLISRKGEVKKVYASDGTVVNNGSFFVEFDEMIIENITMGMVSVINEDEYFKLSSGIDRRALVFLYSKRKAFGNRFTFEMDELTLVLGIEASPKKSRERVLKALTKSREASTKFTFEIVKQRGLATYDVYVEFSENVLLELSEFDHFVNALHSIYTKESMDIIGVDSRDIKVISEEFKKKWKQDMNGSEVFNFLGDELPIGFFLVDLALHQVIKTGYTLTGGLKSLVNPIYKSMVGDKLTLPDGYKYFAPRQMRENEKEKAKQIIASDKTIKKEIEVKKKADLQSSFNDAWDLLIQKNPALLSQIETDAKVILEKDGFVKEGDAVYKLMLNEEVRTLAIERFENGTLLNSIRIN